MVKYRIEVRWLGYITEGIEDEAIFRRVFDEYSLAGTRRSKESKVVPDIEECEVNTEL